MCRRGYLPLHWYVLGAQRRNQAVDIQRRLPHMAQRIAFNDRLLSWLQPLLVWYSERCLRPVARARRIRERGQADDGCEEREQDTGVRASLNACTSSDTLLRLLTPRCKYSTGHPHALSASAKLARRALRAVSEPAADVSSTVTDAKLTQPLRLASVGVYRAEPVLLSSSSTGSSPNLSASASASALDGLSGTPLKDPKAVTCTRTALAEGSPLPTSAAPAPVLVASLPPDLAPRNPGAGDA